VLRRHEALIEKLRKYAKEDHQRDLSAREAEDALLAQVEEHSVPLLRAVVAGAPYQPVLLGEDLEYIVSAFIVHLFERDPEGFDYLEVLLKGSMLASVLYLPNVGEVERRFERKTVVYFDTPVLLRALGYEGPEAEESAREVLNLAYELGAGLGCFEHTVTEIRGVLSGVAAAMSRHGSQRGQPRSVEAYFVKAGFTASDIDVLVDRVEQDLESLRVAVLARPKHVIELTVDEVALEKALQERVGYPQRQTLLYDLDSLTAVHRLRRGETAMRLETCRAILITTNTPMVAVARELLVGDRAGAWPPAISYNDFATLLWLKRPLDAPELPRKQIIADCYAALEPGGALWTKYLDEIERLESRGKLTEEEFFLLRYSFDAKHALMERTLGDPQRVTAETVERVLAEARDTIQAPVLDQLRAAQRAEADASARAADADASAERRIRAAETRAAAAEAAEAHRAARIDTARRRARQRAARQARFVRGILIVVTALLLATAAWFSLPSAVRLAPQEVPGLVRWLLRSALAFAAVVGIASTVSDWRPVVAVRRVELFVAGRLERRYLAKSLAADLLVPDRPAGSS
jgi:hypothetical protein